MPEPIRNSETAAYTSAPREAGAGNLSGAEVFGLIVSVIVCAYLVYALLRGERL